MKFRAGGFPSKPSALTNRAVSLTLVGDAAHFLPWETHRILPRSIPLRQTNVLTRLAYSRAPVVSSISKTTNWDSGANFLPPVCRGTRQQEEGDGGKVLEDDCAGDDCRPSFVWWRLSSGDGHTSSSGYWQV